MTKLVCFFFLMGLIFISSCNENKSGETQTRENSTHSCMNVPNRFGADADSNKIQFSGDTSVVGMAFIPGGNFDMGGDNKQASGDEFPKHKVQVTAKVQFNSRKL